MTHVTVEFLGESAAWPIYVFPRRMPYARVDTMSAGTDTSSRLYKNETYSRDERPASGD